MFLERIRSTYQCAEISYIGFIVSRSSISFKSPQVAAVYSNSGEILNLFCLKSTLAEALQTLSTTLVPETPLT